MERIAVIGVSCLFPDAATPEQFWQNLVSGKDSISIATEEQMGVDPRIFYDPIKGRTGETGKYYCMQGGYIRNFQFDATGYQIAAELLQSLDYIYQWPLYVAKQALQDAGYYDRTDALANCGIILGNLSSPTRSSYRLISPIYQQATQAGVRSLLDEPDVELPKLPTQHSLSLLNMLTAGYPSAVVAQALGLSGVHFSLDAACASSLYSVKLACDYLNWRKADLMLAGAVSCTDPFMTHTAFSLFQAYPDEDGTSRPLDQTSAGLMTGEGAGMLLLKRYSDAVRDGDRIYATIAGVGLSNDGRGKHFLSPNPKGQILAFERAYQEAGIHPQDIHYVECHGTGTPLGDRTELNSMEAFFGQYGASPQVGSVKSNLGHLLTAAGMPSMIKVILSLNHGLIPPTIRVENPLASSNNTIPSENIVKALAPWRDATAIRRAAVSAFGFGGTNSHLIFETGTQPTPEIATTPVLEKMAIVGMDTFFGRCSNLDAFERTIYEGRQNFVNLPSDRWRGIETQSDFLQANQLPDGQAPKGAYVENFELDYLHFRVPPDEKDQPIPQQLLIQKVADAAAQDAQLQPGANVAVIVAMGTELASHQVRAGCDLLWQVQEALRNAGIALSPEQTAHLEQLSKDSLQAPVQVNQCMSFIGNIMASRISTQWDFSGPTFTISAEENSAFKALEVAQLLLSQGQVEAVVIGAVDLAGGIEHVLLRNQITQLHTGTPTLSFDANAKGWLIGEGAGAIVLKRLETAQQDQAQIYAIVDAISIVQDNSVQGNNIAQGNIQDNVAPPVALPQAANANLVARACGQALQQAGISPDQIGYLEVFGSGIEQEDEAEMQGLGQVYRSDQLTCAIGSVKANIGHTFAASGMASLIKTALCLYHRYLPATPNWSAPKNLAAWNGSSFYVPESSRIWLPDETVPKRSAAINGLGIDRSYTHVVLSEDPNRLTRSPCYLTQQPFRLFPIAARDRAALFAQLDALAAAIDMSADLAKLARQTFETFRQQGQATHILAIVGHDKGELLSEIEHARKGIPAAFERSGEWKTPLGSYFTTQPLGKTGGVAFVYPGAFTSYLGMGRNVHRLFPKTHEYVAAFSSTTALRRIISKSTNRLFPRSIKALTRRQLETLEIELLNDTFDILLAGMIGALLSTMTMRDYFKVKPRSAFGYSLGEISMMFALQIWTNGERLAERAETTQLFKTRLSGPKNAVREFWGLPTSDAPDDGQFWANYALLTTPQAVQDILKHEDRVYLTHINTPNEVVIGGDVQACQRVIKALGCNYFPTPVNSVIHCEPMRSEYAEIADWLKAPIMLPSDLTLYSAANYDTVTLTSEAIAHNIATALCQSLDFPRLIDQTYGAGDRIFLELGPGNSCTRWISESLKGKPHLALNISNRGMDDHVAVVRLLAKLVSHQVSLDLSPLYATESGQPPRKKSLIKTVRLGGDPITPAMLSEENVRQFEPYRRKIAPFRQRSVQPPREKVLVTAREPSKPSPQLASVLHKSAAQPVWGSTTPIPSAISPQPMIEESPALKPIPPIPSVSDPASPVTFSQTHTSFLRSRQESLHHMAHLIELQITAMQRSLSLPTAEMAADLVSGADHRLNAYLNPQAQLDRINRASARFQPLPIVRSPKSRDIIFDEADLREFAEGSIANVFGKEYAEIDTYPSRVRLPMYPYLFISRVTKLEAQRGCFEPCFLETEYDIPEDAWYVMQGQVPVPVLAEGCHGNMVLISYLGIDFETQGKRYYRALDGETRFVGELPRAGDTVRAEVRINSFARSSGTTLYFFSSNHYVGDRRFLELKSGAGFFTPEELQRGGKSATYTRRELEERAKIQKQSFKPFLQCEKTSFSQAEISHLMAGDLATCFGAHYDQGDRNSALIFPPPPLRMIDRILSVDPKGGAWGLGLVVGEKQLEADAWYFNCHFKDDYCLPGTLISEGVSQLMSFYMLYLGLHTQTTNARFHPLLNLTQTGRNRGQVTPTTNKLTYQIEICEIGLTPEPYIKVEAAVMFQGKTISLSKNFGMKLAPL